MKLLARIVLVLGSSFLMFVLGIMTTFWGSYAIYGEKKVNDTVSGYAILVVAVFIGLGLAIIAIPTAIILSRRILWFRTDAPSHR